MAHSPLSGGGRGGGGFHSKWRTIGQRVHKASKETRVIINLLFYIIFILSYFHLSFGSLYSILLLIYSFHTEIISQRPLLLQIPMGTHRAIYRQFCLFGFLDFSLDLLTYFFQFVILITYSYYYIHLITLLYY